VSSSNRVSAQFATAERPAYFYLRKVSVSGDGEGIDIVAQTDPAFSGTDYRLYRSVGGNPASLVARLSPTADGTLSWHDAGVDPTAEPCGYQLGVMDGCGRNEMRTAMGYTILPELVSDGQGVVLRWNAYSGWSGSTQYQIVSSPLDADNWQTEGNTWDNEYLLVAGDAMRRYRIQAFEGFDSEHQRDDSLQSTIVFHRPYTTIWMPNAFTPTEASNNKVQPISQYINPNGYSFLIFNRQGMLVFSTTATDEAWDGRYHGEMQPNGAYTYKITYSQNDGTNQYLIGTVMLVR
jgi:gliding motility-associated-like protein